MKWSPEQDKVLKQVATWLMNSDQQVFHLFGYAGTGKTTLAKYFATGVEGQVLFAAYTGKAAYVLQQKGCLGASTIHALIYQSRDKGRSRLVDIQKQLEALMNELKDSGLNQLQIDEHHKVLELKEMVRKEEESLKQPFFILNQDSAVKNAQLVIIDEVSMVDAKMAEDLLSFGTKILVLGDPAQLPPVGGAGYFTEGVTPDAMLTEIHRQAAESPILRMATDVRNKVPLRLGEYGSNCKVVDEGKVGAQEALAFDQILVGRNKTRFATNNRVRRLKGHSEKYPEQQDKIVCLRNDHELGLLNGALFNVGSVEGIIDNKVHMNISPEFNNQCLEVLAHEHHFLGKGEDLQWYEKKEAQEFDFGYALTVHKAQGSQWDSVLLFDESFCFRKDKWRWLYTGITRAAESITVVNM